MSYHYDLNARLDLTSKCVNKSVTTIKNIETNTTILNIKNMTKLDTPGKLICSNRYNCGYIDTGYYYTYPSTYTSMKMNVINNRSTRYMMYNNVIFINSNNQIYMYDINNHTYTQLLPIDNINLNKYNWHATLYTITYHLITFN